MTDDMDAANEPEAEPTTSGDLVMTDGASVTLDVGFEDTEDMYIQLSTKGAAIRISLTAAQSDTLQRYLMFVMDTDTQ